ncbi:hypothetical protein C0989_006858 [Termitomyces sp. Mn162]|nr:hypothetical protein C0989_006858 [Termitomyces sp. Mn162]
MSVVAPAPSSSRGEVVLQPNYFTSSIFIKALREDITTLIHSYHDLYTKSPPTHPFSLFKHLWSTLGWRWMHLMVFDDRPREMLLNVVHRLFLERMVRTEAPFTRAIALFGLYTFFLTQPRGTAPPLYSLSHIPIPVDQFIALKALTNSLNVDHLHPLQPHVSHILSILLQGKVFFLAPESGSRSLNPRSLPRENFIEGAVLPLDINAPKKKGRPTKRDKIKKAKLDLDSLDKWLYDTPPPLSTAVASSLSSSFEASSGNSPVETTLTQYQNEKARILDAIDPQTTPAASASHANSTIQKSNQFILERLKTAEGFFSAESTLGDQSTGVSRVERAVNELGVTNSVGRLGGALNLLEGAGKTQP